MKHLNTLWYRITIFFVNPCVTINIKLSRGITITKLVCIVQMSTNQTIIYKRYKNYHLSHINETRVILPCFFYQCGSIFIPWKRDLPLLKVALLWHRHLFWTPETGEKCPIVACPVGHYGHQDCSHHRMLPCPSQINTNNEFRLYFEL